MSKHRKLRIHHRGHAAEIFDCETGEHLGDLDESLGTFMETCKQIGIPGKVRGWHKYGFDKQKTGDKMPELDVPEDFQRQPEQSLSGELKTMVRQHMREHPSDSFAMALSSVTASERGAALWQAHREGRS